MASSFEKSRCIILPRVSFCPGLPYLSFVISRSVNDLEANISFEYDKVYFKVRMKSPNDTNQGPLFRGIKVLRISECSHHIFGIRLKVIRNWKTNCMIVHAWADQLLPQLLKGQFDTPGSLCKHVEQMHEGVKFRKNNL